MKELSILEFDDFEFECSTFAARSCEELNSEAARLCLLFPVELCNVCDTFEGCTLVRVRG